LLDEWVCEGYKNLRCLEPEMECHEGRRRVCGAARPRGQERLLKRSLQQARGGDWCAPHRVREERRCKQMGAEICSDSAIWTH